MMEAIAMKSTASILVATLIALAFSATLLSCGTSEPAVVDGEQTTKTPEVSPEVDVASLLTTGAPSTNSWPKAEPGTSKNLEPAYEGFPPLIPHAVAGLELGRESNECLDCHAEGMEVEEGHVATKVPASHYVNEHTAEKQTDSPVGIRRNCLQCHVVQTGEAPPYK
jgi:cytochrome c-type protein NapB